MTDARVVVESLGTGAEWLVDTPGSTKGVFAYWWHSRHDPVWNHYIRAALVCRRTRRGRAAGTVGAQVLRPASVDSGSGRGACSHSQGAGRWHWPACVSGSQPKKAKKRGPTPPRAARSLTTADRRIMALVIPRPTRDNRASDQ